MSCNRHPRARRNDMSVHAQAALADRNGQWINNSGMMLSAESASGMSTDPVGCVRPPPEEWYVDAATCAMNAPADTTCDPRFINGVWTYYKPYAADPVACNGGLPADILPQVLDSTSIVQNNSWYTIDNVMLKLMMNGNIGELSFSTMVDGVEHTYDLVFTQRDFIAVDLFSPLITRYSILMPDLPPELNQRAVLEINLTNGYATVLLPMGNGSSIIQFVMTNIVPVMVAA